MDVKCPKCGYVFECDDSEGKSVRCPLCSEESTEFEAVDTDIKPTQHRRRSGLRMALEWAVFGLSFSAFIVVIYLLVKLISGA